MLVLRTDSATEDTVESELRLQWSFVHVGNSSDHDHSRFRLLLSDCGRVAAERQERRLGRGFRRSRQPDRVWPARGGLGSFASDDLVRDHLHAHVDRALDFCRKANRTHVRAVGRESDADEVAASDTSCAVRASDRSTKPGAPKVRSQVLGHGSQEQLLDLSPTFPNNRAHDLVFPETYHLRPSPAGRDSVPFLLLWLFLGRGPGSRRYHRARSGRGCAGNG